MTKLPTWATNSDYSTGPKTGSATKIEPSGGEIANGYIPGEKVPAEILNWQIGAQNAWIDRLSRLALAPLVNYDPIQGLTGLGGFIAGAYDSDYGKCILIGNGFSDTDGIISSESMDYPNEAWSDETVTSRGTAEFRHIHYGNGLFVIGCSVDTTPSPDKVVIYTSPGNGTWTRREVDAQNTYNELIAGCYESTSGYHVLLCPQDNLNSYVLRSTSGSSWAKVTLPVYGLDLANNRQGRLLTTGAYSDDGGATWTTATMPTVTGLCWDEQNQRFVGVYTFGSNTLVYASEDGTSWDLLSTISGFKGRRCSAHKGMIIIQYDDQVDPLGIYGDVVFSPDGGYAWERFRMFVQSPDEGRFIRAYVLGPDSRARVFYSGYSFGFAPRSLAL